MKRVENAIHPIKKNNFFDDFNPVNCLQFKTKYMSYFMILLTIKGITNNVIKNAENEIKAS